MTGQRFPDTAGRTGDKDRLRMPHAGEFLTFRAVRLLSVRGDDILRTLMNPVQ